KLSPSEQTGLQARLKMNVGLNRFLKVVARATTHSTSALTRVNKTKARLINKAAETPGAFAAELSIARQRVCLRIQEVIFTGRMEMAVLQITPLHDRVVVR